MSIESGIGLLDIAELRLEQADYRVKAFMNSRMIDLAIQEIIDPLKNLARSRGHAQVFIDAINVKQLGFLKFGIVIEEFFTANRMPLNILLEFGWSEHFIFPVNVLALHWYENGISRYSKGHMVRGFPGYHILFSLFTWGFIDRFTLRLIKETNMWLEDTRFK